MHHDLQTSDRVAARVGRYEIVGKLATGGMAELLLACLRGEGAFERPVVIKRILPHLAELSDFTSMFMDEARIAASIRHPNVVRVEALEKDEDGLYLVMEYLEGESAANLMRRLAARALKIEPGIAAHVVAEACAGLHAAHELADPDGRSLEVVHRDVSPENVFIGYDGAVKVVDFGIAKAADRITQTEVGQIKGKFRYMSPEQIEGAALDRRSDVFALGIVLFELMTGHRLFARTTRAATMRAVLEAPLVPPSTLAPSVDAELDRICLRALSRAPGARYPDAAEMRRDLHRYLHGSQAGALPPEERVGVLMRRLFEDRIEQKRAMLRQMREGADVGTLPSAEIDVTVELPTAAAVTPAPLTAPAPSRPAPASRRGAWIAGSVLLLLGLGAAGAYTLVPRPQPASPTSVAAARPSFVQIEVESEPAGAQLWVDGERRGATPAEVRLERDDEAHALRLERHGFEPLDERFTADVDQRLRFTLDEEAPAERTEPPTAAPDDPTPAPARRRRSRRAPAAPPPETPSFERFD